MKPSIDPSLRPIDPLYFDDPSEAYLDESDILMIVLSNSFLLMGILTLVRLTSRFSRRTGAVATKSCLD